MRNTGAKSKLVLYLKKYKESYTSIFDLAIVAGLTTDKTRLILADLEEAEQVDRVLLKTLGHRAHYAYQWIGD